jgi:hypothetical protein
MQTGRPTMTIESKTSRAAASLLYSLAVVTMWMYLVLALIEDGSHVF